MNKNNSRLLAVIMAITLHASFTASAELQLPPIPLPPIQSASAITPPSDIVTIPEAPAINDSDLIDTPLPPASAPVPAEPALPIPVVPATQPAPIALTSAAPIAATSAAPTLSAPVPAAQPTSTVTTLTVPVPSSVTATLSTPMVITPAAPMPAAMIANTQAARAPAATEASGKQHPLIDLLAENHKIGKSVPAPYIDDNALKIATGSVDGLYYPVGQALCRAINRDKKDLNLWCDVESTEGSIYNLSAVIQAYDNVALVQSDWQKQAFTGMEKFGAEQKSFENLRFLFSLYSEAITIIVRKGSTINHLDDIAHHAVSMGASGSGVRSVMQTIMSTKGWDSRSFSSVSTISQSEQPAALCKGDIDVMIVAIGHPNDIVKEVSKMCEIRILNIASDPDIQKILNTHTEYSPVTIEGGIYPGVPQAVKTFGVKATVVTTAEISDDVAYKIVKAVFSNLDYFKKLNPVFSYLSADKMITEGQIAPIHAGAVKYFREAKYIK